MILSVCILIAGIVLLVWSADRFVDGAAAAAGHFGMPPLLIGMVIVGFGTSLPEMIVSGLAAFAGTPGIALGNVFGSNIANIGLILGVSSLISPIRVHSSVLRKELPILAGVTLLLFILIFDRAISRLDAFILLAVFAGIMGWTILQGMKHKEDALSLEFEKETVSHKMPLGKAIFWCLAGLTLLVISSRMLVWSAVTIAHALGISDLIIGLTIVAVGTSLPELASSIMAARKGEHDIALGNVLGSNLFNTLAVVGLAGTIKPLGAETAILSRDFPVMGGLTVLLFVIGYGFRGRPGRVNRFEGASLVLLYVLYTAWLVLSATGATA